MSSGETLQLSEEFSVLSPTSEYSWMDFAPSKSTQKTETFQGILPKTKENSFSAEIWRLETGFATALARYREGKPQTPENWRKIGKKTMFCLFLPYFPLFFLFFAYFFSYFLEFGVFLFCSWPTQSQNWFTKSNICEENADNFLVCHTNGTKYGECGERAFMLPFQPKCLPEKLARI